MKSSNRERLLKLIDGDPKAFEAAQKKRSSKKVAFDLKNSLYGLRENIGGLLVAICNGLKNFVIFIVKGRPASRDVPHHSLFTLNRYLIVIVFIIGIYIAVDFTRNIQLHKPDIMSSVNETLGEGDSILSGVTVDGPMKLGPKEYYLDQIAAQDVFDSGRISGAGRDGVGALASVIKFVGVDWSESPTAMIEDIEKSETHFVKKGQSVLGYTVVEVLKDRVLVAYQEKVFELK